MPSEAPGDISDDFLMLQIPFDSQRFKEILNVNKDSDSTTLYLSTRGLAKFTFDNEDISSKYFITRNEQIID